MITDGISRMSDRLRKKIDALEKNDPVDHTIDNVQPQQLLDNDLALLDILQSLSSALSLTSGRGVESLGRLLANPGVLIKGEFKANPEEGEYHAQGNILTIAANRIFLAGRVVSGSKATLSMPPAPSTGTRDDLVFLELWNELIDPAAGSGLQSPVVNVYDRVVYKDGWVDATEFIPFHLAFPDIDQKYLDVAEPGDIVRHQWQWRYRVVSGVNFSSYPLGLGSPSVTATGTTHTFKKYGSENEFYAGIGTPSSESTALFFWALPLFRVKRSVAVPGISKDDIIDLRPQISLFQAVQDEFSNIEQLIQGIEAALNAHANSTGNIHSTKHNDLLDVVGVNPASTNATRDKHVSNADAKRWEDHTKAKGNPHETKHSDLDGVDGVNLTNTNTTRNKHISNADGKRWEDHTKAKGNPHETKHSDLGDVLAVNPASTDTTRNKHVSNADAKRWDEGATALPSGVIVMWSGSIGSIPSGWRLCDGTGGTPDLRDRFIVGAGGEYAVGARGGAKEVTLTEAQMPSHTHGYMAHEHMSSGSGNVMSFQAGAVSRHTTAAGGNQPHENRPPYYALAYIMKV